jgi:hypothetical protein
MTAAERVVDPEVLERLLGQVIADAGGAVALPLALLGDRLGLFAARRGRPGHGRGTR